MKTKYGREVNPCGKQLWCSLAFGGNSPANQFRRWGAGEVVQMPGEGDGYTRYMVRLEVCPDAPHGLWYYAHTCGSGCYISLHVGWPAKTGEEASAMKQHDSLVDSLNRAEQQVKEFTEALTQAHTKVESTLVRSV